jgi:hypothetical protein
LPIARVAAGDDLRPGRISLDFFSRLVLGRIELPDKCDSVLRALLTFTGKRIAHHRLE